MVFATQSNVNRPCLVTSDVVALSDLKCSDKTYRQCRQTYPSRPNVPENTSMSVNRNHLDAHCRKTTASRTCQVEV